MSLFWNCMNRSIRYLLFANIFFVVWMYFGEHFSYAGGETSAVATWLADVFSIFTSILNILVTPLISLAWWLLSPDWTYGDIGWLRPMLYKFWVTAANFTYFLYAIILIGAALANIFSFWKDNPYLIKKMLPKIALGILITPFTWFIVSAVLSFVNIMTVSVINIPFDTIAGWANITSNDFLKKIPLNKEYLIDLTGWPGDGNTPTEWADKKPAAGKLPIITPQWAETNVADLIKESPFWLVSAYAYGIFKIQDYKNIGTSNIKSITDIFSLGLKGLFALIFYIMFAIVLIALCVVLFVRAIRMWFFIALSPILVFLEVIGQSKSGDSKHFTVTDFLTAAFIPVWVWAILSVGLVLTSMVMAGVTPTTKPTECSSSEYVLSAYWKGCLGYNKNNTDGKEESIFSFWWVKLKIIWNYNGVKKDGVPTQQSGSVIQDIIWGLIALFVLWAWVMAALKSSNITKWIVEPFEKFGSQVAGSWKYAPLPVPGWSVHGAKTAMDRIGAAPARAADQRFESSAAKAFADKLGWGSNVEQAKIWQGLKENALQVTASHTMDSDAIINSQKYGNQLNASWFRSNADAIKKLAEAVSINPEWQKNMQKDEKYRDPKVLMEMTEKVRSGTASEEDKKYYIATASTVRNGADYDKHKRDKLITQYNSELAATSSTTTPPAAGWVTGNSWGWINWLKAVKIGDGTKEINITINNKPATVDLSRIDSFNAPEAWTNADWKTTISKMDLASFNIYMTDMGVSVDNANKIAKKLWISSKK